MSPSTAASAPAVSPVISCAGVAKRYGKTMALAGVSLTVAPGSLYGFLGPNGAGKSTLVKILTGLVSPSEGEVQVLGGRPGDRAVQARVGYLPELFRFPSWLTGRELLEFHARLLGVPARADDLCDLVGLSDARDRRVGQYSKGMQQRLGLAQALVGDPDVVFLDEPTSALDPLGRLDVRDVLVHLRERGTAVFLNSHLLTEVEKVCDQVAVIARGRIVAEGRTEDLLARSEVQIRVGAQTQESLTRLAEYLPDRRPEAAAPFAYQDGRLVFPVEGAAGVPELVRAVIDAGLPVYEVTQGRRSLEDIFVELVRQDTGAGV